MNTTTPAGEPPDRLCLALVVVVLAALAASAVAPFDRGTWLLEVAPVLFALPLLWKTYRSYPLSRLLYVLIAAHALVLILGGTYTYARVPPGFWLQELLALERNPYDRVGHFMQGFVPALVAREIFVRGRHVAGPKMTGFLAVCVAGAVSAFYELLEWWAALAFGQGAHEFLGTQGDSWDTQADMFMAFTGATLAVTLLARAHDRSIARVPWHAPMPGTSYTGVRRGLPAK